MRRPGTCSPAHIMGQAMTSTHTSPELLSSAAPFPASPPCRLCECPLHHAARLPAKQSLGARAHLSTGQCQIVRLWQHMAPGENCSVDCWHAPAMMQSLMAPLCCLQHSKGPRDWEVAAGHRHDEAAAVQQECHARAHVCGPACAPALWLAHDLRGDQPDCPPPSQGLPYGAFTCFRHMLCIWAERRALCSLLDDMHECVLEFVEAEGCTIKIGSEAQGDERGAAPQVGGIEWFCKEQRGMQALHAPEWRDPEKTVLSLRNLEVRQPSHHWNQGVNRAPRLLLGPRAGSSVLIFCMRCAALLCRHVTDQRHPKGF